MALYPAFECEEVVSSHVVLNTTDRWPGTSVAVECQDGYQLSGSSVLMCGEDGYWRGMPPICREMILPKHDNDHLLIIIVVAAATAAALVVLLCAIYMLCCSVHKKKQANSLPSKNEPFISSISDISHFYAVTQDCVGMPPVTMDTVNSRLKGRIPSEEATPTQAAEVSETPASSDCGSDKVFIY